MIHGQHVTTDIETKRLAALSSYAVLDTLPEKEYDAITRLASYICQVPMALISLIDADRQWFKSVVGVDASETSRADAFCNYTILNDEILEVSNAAEDDTFKENPFVKGAAQIRFYAGAPLIDPDGNRLGSLCVVDVVPRQLTFEQRDALRTLADEVMSHLVLRKQRRELQQSLAIHKQFYNLFNSSPDIHFIADKDANIELINKSVKNILGYEPEDALGKPLWSFVVGNTPREQFVPLIEKALSTGQSFDLETKTFTVEGKEKWIGWCGIYKDEKWYANGRDITYQKSILAELEQLSLVASKMINGVSVSDKDDNVIWTNEAFEKITGYAFEDVQGKRLRSILVNDANNANNNPIQQYNDLIKGKSSYSVHVYATRKNGEDIWLSQTTSIIFDEAGEVEKYIRVWSDITARKAIQKDLEVLSFAARKSPSGMLSRDATGTVIWMNEALENITGYTFAEMQGKRFGTILIGEDTDMDVFKNAVKAVSEQRPYNCEILIYRKDRTPAWVSMSNSPLFDEAGDVERQITTMLDITERKKAEEESKLLSLVASNTTSGVVINNADGEIEWVNGAFEKITGFNITDVGGTHLGDVLQGSLLI
ncbi:PAS domain S-box protein [Mucilaginibacter antarcticus]|uniref:PAS domain S-box protein n=1 Tax=Mucilaginibacter antarcticus TaxID=1855725 RepID=UPI00362D06C8